MKHKIGLFLSAILFAAAAVQAEPSRKNAADAFDKMLEKGKIANTAAAKGTSKFAIAAQCGNTQVESGVKVWFELADGTLVDPAKHKWQRKEKFKIWFVSAVPVLVGLYQNYPHDQLKSRQVFPDKKFPRTFNVVPAGRPQMLPVEFITDNDLEDELMSMVLVRADADTSMLVETAEPEVLLVHQEHESISISAERTETTVAVIPGTMKGFEAMQKANDNINAMDDTKRASSKFAIVSCAGVKPRSRTPDEVATIVLGVGPVTQVQFKLHKD
jgi:hypothetical protein